LPKERRKFPQSKDKKMTDENDYEQIAVSEQHQETTPKDNEQINRVVIITGEKGGVGKTTFARGLAQIYLDQKKKFVAFDADQSNPQLTRFYGSECDIQSLDPSIIEQLDSFPDNLRSFIFPPDKPDRKIVESKNLFLLDLPSQSIKYLQDAVEELELLKALNQYDVRPTMVVVINQSIDSVNQLLNLCEFCEGRVDYVIVKNLFFGENFLKYQDMRETIITTVQEQGAKYIDITMPTLVKHVYDYLDINNMTFGKAITQNETWAVKGRVSSWLRKFQEQILSAKDLLGLT